MNGLAQWRTAQQDKLSAGSNQLEINILWRIQHDQFGYSFHDRFLIVTSKENSPRAWSLGTSINHAGCNHHILQAVSNPGYIVDAFEELWNQLDHESCIVWPIKETMHE